VRETSGGELGSGPRQWRSKGCSRRSVDWTL